MELIRKVSLEEESFELRIWRIDRTSTEKEKISQAEGLARTNVWKQGNKKAY